LCLCVGVGVGVGACVGACVRYVQTHPKSLGKSGQ
jgi:hypothetical protein